MSDLWWEHLEPPPVVDAWMARQIVRFHDKGTVPCATCSTGLVCERLKEARAILAADGSTTDASMGSQDGPTVRP